MDAYKAFDLDTTLKNLVTDSTRRRPPEVQNEQAPEKQRAGSEALGADRDPFPARELTAEAFIDDCCVLDADARTLGRDLLMAHARWRRVVEAPDRTASWQEAEEVLRASGCMEKMNDGSPIWLGVLLKDRGPHTAPLPPEPSPARRTYAPCPRCGCTERWPTDRGTRVCVACFLARNTSQEGK